MRSFQDLLPNWKINLNIQIMHYDIVNKSDIFFCFEIGKIEIVKIDCD
jgi:hypothetical protein